jgi:hypothetical protein
MRIFAPLCLFTLLTANALAHPIPDIPVRTAFQEGKPTQVQVDINPRVFEADPNKAPSLIKSAFDLMPEAERQTLKTKAAAYIVQCLGFYIEPQGQLQPQFTFDFCTLEGLPLAKADDPVVMTGTAILDTTKMTGYSIGSLGGNNLNVRVHHTINGLRVKRFQILFPTERSHPMTLASETTTEPLHLIPDSDPDDLETETPAEVPVVPPAPIINWQLIGISLSLILLALSLIRRAVSR